MSATPAIVAALRNSVGAGDGAAMLTTPENVRLIQHYEGRMENALRDLNRCYQALADLEAKLGSEDEATAWTALQSFTSHAGASGTPASYLDSMTAELNQAYAFAMAVL